jgi:two-component system CheB/CheR fusion protein
LPATSARDGEPLRANHVYVLPSDGLLTLAGGRLRVAQRADGHPMVIDELLTRLAADLGSHAIALILSGSGSDGVKGAQAIKAAGGTTLAQDPDMAEHGSVGGTETILVVDDEETVGAWISRTLDMLGYTTLVAANG